MQMTKGSFPFEKATKLGNLAFRGGGPQKIKKVTSFIGEKFKIRGGIRKSKKFQVLEGTKD